MTIRFSLHTTTMFYGMAGAVFLSASAASGADLFTKAPLANTPPPLGAVDGINGKVDGFGGSLDNRSIYGAKGSMSIPLQGQFGAQIDGMVGSLDSQTFAGIAGHLFWRDPSRGLTGLYVNHTHWDQFGGVHVTQIAGEGEYYWQRWTLQGIVGVEFGNSASNTTTSILPQNGNIPGVISTFTEGYDVKSRMFDQINLKYYFTDNWDGYVGHRHLGGKSAFALGTEYALPLRPGVMGSAFLEGRVGDGEFHGIWGGLRIYFGQNDKPLIARHRQDDPNNWSVDTLFSILNSHTSSGTSCQSSQNTFGSCETGGGGGQNPG